MISAIQYTIPPTYSISRDPTEKHAPQPHWHRVFPNPRTRAAQAPLPIHVCSYTDASYPQDRTGRPRRERAPNTPVACALAMIPDQSSSQRVHISETPLRTPPCLQRSYWWVFHYITPGARSPYTRDARAAIVHYAFCHVVQIAETSLGTVMQAPTRHATRAPRAVQSLSMIARLHGCMTEAR